MAKRIRLLDKKVAELIAAGEVVERPCSVVKAVSYTHLEWVVLTPSEVDRRNKIIGLTQTGRQVLCAVAEDLQAHECLVWEKLGPRRTKALLENTARYNQLFKEVSG